MSIDQLDVGDYVLAYDEETGEIAFYPVTAVMVHDEVIEATPRYSFYTAMKGTGEYARIHLSLTWLFPFPGDIGVPPTCSPRSGKGG